jgi:hypothetical protein
MQFEFKIIILNFLIARFFYVGRDSSVSIVILCGIDGPGSNPVGGSRFFLPVYTSPGTHPYSCKMCNESLTRGQNGWGLTLTTYNYLGTRLKKEESHTLILWAFKDCYRLNFTFFTSDFTGKL